MDTVWMLAEICGPETMIQSFHRTKEGAKRRKRELIDAYPLPHYRQRYSESLIIEPHTVED